MPQLLPSEGINIAAAAQEVWRDEVHIADPLFVRDSSRETHHISQNNIKSREM
jgi:hypothetical protein